MRRIILFLLIFAFLHYSMHIYAEDERYEDYVFTKDGNLRIPPGMELKKVGDAKIIMPKGGKIFKAGDALIPETSSEYAARKFVDIEGRLEKIERELGALKNEIGDLKSAVSKISQYNKKSE